MKIATINTRGFSSIHKQKFLLNFMKRNNIDIAAIQEVNNPMIILQDPDYDVIINAPNGLGTAILFRHNNKPRRIQKSPYGRIIRAEFENLTVVNVYGYANASADQKRNFYQEMLPTFLRPYDENLILLGDFNSTLGEATGGTRIRALEDLVKGMRLLVNPGLSQQETNNFTFRSKAGQSHIDILIEECMSESVTEFKILPYAASDHESVIIDISFELQPNKTQKIKSPCWKFNVNHFGDPDFKETFTQFYECYSRRKFLYKNIIDWWELDFKHNFKIVSSHFSKLKKADFNNKLRFKENACRTWQII